ncbi:folate-sensitive fragile site protein Fra10Ac1-domain-containing protein [Pavlovales sp. CCMP2436]|nr:folate-sensitive fragile site protein Fra10Ac1-domain-containing protein [Pavlovales sp. CCMP2436]|mmetsp:Transcript_15486/g.39315  ORF Transcript_15486/g.39315 Transcript_15486/m.39315 type:complete len:284 (+) Transcript_15486:132-983(+)
MASASQRELQGAYKRRPTAQAAQPPPDRADLLARELRRQPAATDYENARERHRRFVSGYQSRYIPTAAAPTGPSELDIAREHSRFVWRDDETGTGVGLVWEERVARNYYDRLFKEYAIADLSQSVQHGRLGLRWRTEAEVVDGKGHFSCGNRKCSEAVGLCSYEVLFSYSERGEKHSALVKLRLCPACAPQLGSHHRAQKRAASPPRAAPAAKGAKHEHRRAADVGVPAATQAGSGSRLIAAAAQDAQTPANTSGPSSRGQQTDRGTPQAAGVFEAFLHEMLL